MKLALTQPYTLTYINIRTYTYQREQGRKGKERKSKEREMRGRSRVRRSYKQ